MYKRFLQKFTDCVEPDVAMLYLAESLDIVNVGSKEPFYGAKWAYWSANAVNEGLYDMLLSLVKMGFLEMGTDPENEDCFRAVNGINMIDDTRR